MPHRIARRQENEAKRRQLVWLSAASSLLIVIMWIFYMERTFTLPADDASAPKTDSVSVFENGLAAIRETVETGLVNSYLYFHTVASEGKTFTITK